MFLCGHLCLKCPADSLCEWENHRTESEFENSRVTKNFLFQFINNYFVLFYIAYLREIKDPITDAAHPCAGGNCLPELQTQLIVVFTAKTIGKQLALSITHGVGAAVQVQDSQSGAILTGTNMVQRSVLDRLDQHGILPKTTEWEIK